MDDAQAGGSQLKVGGSRLVVWSKVYICLLLVYNRLRVTICSVRTVRLANLSPRPKEVIPNKADETTAFYRTRRRFA
jgi:hypothetical protein